MYTGGRANLPSNGRPILRHTTSHKIRPFENEQINETKGKLNPITYKVIHSEREIRFTGNFDE
jgi:hypothetical protein